MHEKTLIRIIARSFGMFTLALVGRVLAQSEGKGPSPELEESDRLPLPTHRMDLGISLDDQQIDRFDLLIVRVTLTNRDSSPLTIKTRRDGAPYDLASLVAKGNGPFERHDQWLMRNSPEYRDKDLRITLQRGDSTSGDFLILFGGPPTGLPFADAGRYRVKVACQPDGNFAPIYSNELIVTVAPGTGANAAFLRDLEELTYKHSGYNREAMVRNYGPEYHIGIELLQKIVAQDRPHLVAPSENPQDRKEMELVDALTVLLERHPDTAYSGYVARFLGLVYIKTFKHEVSIADGKVWQETGKRPERTTEALIAHPAYEKALRYLTTADKANLWPRTTAAVHLGGLYLMSEQVEKAEEVAARLRTTYPGSSGQEAAEGLLRGVAEFKARLAEQRDHDSEK